MQDVYYMYFCELMRKMPAKYFYTECIICPDNSSYSFRVNFISVVQICPTEISIIFSFFDRQWNMDTVKKPDFCRHIDSFPFFVLFCFFGFFFIFLILFIKRKRQMVCSCSFDAFVILLSCYNSWYNKTDSKFC